VERREEVDFEEEEAEEELAGGAAGERVRRVGEGVPMRFLAESLSRV
jgi:hypothetical protein